LEIAQRHPPNDYLPSHEPIVPFATPVLEIAQDFSRTGPTMGFVPPVFPLKSFSIQSPIDQTMNMQKQITIFLVVASFALAALQSLCAGTIPAGSALVVKIADSIYTKDAVGRQFTAQLDQDIVVKGTVVARAGTTFIGRIETSTKVGPSPLTVNLTGVSVGGKVIPLKTTGAVKPQSVGRGSKRSVTTRDFVLPPGSKLEFHLAQPLTI
jgi:hypothetical protein